MQIGNEINGGMLWPQGQVRSESDYPTLAALLSKGLAAVAAENAGATVPMRLALQLERVKDQPEALMQLGVAHATVQCMELLGRGVPGIHFYTLNKSPATRMIVGALRART